jgi:HSP20 family molecular chaperone IbpA
VKSVITDKVTSELKNGLLYITKPCEDKNSEEKNIEIK